MRCEEFLYTWFGLQGIYRELLLTFLDHQFSVWIASNVGFCRAFSPWFNAVPSSLHQGNGFPIYDVVAFVSFGNSCLKKTHQCLQHAVIIMSNQNPFALSTHREVTMLCNWTLRLAYFFAWLFAFLQWKLQGQNQSCLKLCYLTQDRCLCSQVYVNVHFLYKQCIELPYYITFSCIFESMLPFLVRTQAVERILSLAAEKSPVEPLSFVQLAPCKINWTSTQVIYTSSPRGGTRALQAKPLCSTVPCYNWVHCGTAGVYF